MKVVLGIPATLRAASFLLCVAGGPGCGPKPGTDSGPPPPPPEMCRTPVPLDGTGPYFAEVTNAMGLGFVQGQRIALADLDANGYPDLIVHPTASMVRDDPAGKMGTPTRLRWILMNHPDPAFPNDPTRRRFFDATADSGYGITRTGGVLGRAANFAVFGDVDNDGDLDAFSGAYVDLNNIADDTGDRSELLLNDGAANWTLGPPAPFGGPDMWSVSTAAFVDYDGDGNLDLFVGSWYQRYGVSLTGMQDHLYRGLGDGEFVEATDLVGLTTTPDGFAAGTNHRPTYGVTACDVDSDGDMDLLVSAYGRQWNMLWRNDETSFSDIAPEVGFHGDMLVDYTDDQNYRCYCQTTGNCMAPPPMIVCGSNWNPATSEQPFRLNGNTFSTVCGDIDNDLDMDVLSAEIRHWHVGSASDPSELLVNTGGASWSFLRPGNAATGLERVWTAVDWNEGDIYAAFFDFDNDTRPDILIGSLAYPDTRGFLFWQQPDGTFVEIGPIAGVDFARTGGIGVGDLDRDGDLDLVLATETASNVRVLRNEVGSSSNWLVINLHGSAPEPGGANRAAIGARVIVEAGGVSMVREVSGGYGHFGMHHTTSVAFGLGAACRADRVEVHWPVAAGSVEVFEDVVANYYVSITQGEGFVRYDTD